MTDKTTGMGVPPVKKPYQVAEAERQARAIVEGPFHEGARAMRAAFEARIAKLIADREANGRPKTATVVIGQVGAIAAAIPLPDFVAPDPKPEPGFGWWAGSNDEWYTVGPCSTREDAIADGRTEFGGEGFYILEAAQGAVRFDAGDLINSQYFEDNEGFDFDHNEPDRVGGADVIATADAELQALLDAWVSRWRHTFVAPNLFRATRNSECVAGDIADAGPLTAEEEAELIALEAKAEGGEDFTTDDMGQRYMLRARKAHFAEVAAA